MGCDSLLAAWQGCDHPKTVLPKSWGGGWLHPQPPWPRKGSCRALGAGPLVGNGPGSLGEAGAGQEFAGGRWPPGWSPNGKAMWFPHAGWWRGNKRKALKVGV